MHFSTTDENIQQKRKRNPRALRTTMRNKAKAAGAFLLSAALVMGLVPIIAPNNVMPETNAAPVAKVSFTGKTQEQAKEMMKHMSAREIAQSLTLHEQVCQMFMVFPENVNSSAGAATSSNQNTSYEKTGNSTQVTSYAKTNLEAYPWGGVLCFGGNIKSGAQSRALTSGFDALSTIPMLLAIDEEGGRVQRIGGNSTLRSEGAFKISDAWEYRTQGTAVAKSNAAKMAANCKLAGFNWDFAPVVDTRQTDASGKLNTTPGTRCYSDNYNTVATLTSAAIEGFHEGGIATAIKHFPGHGGVASGADSHLGLTVVPKTIAQLEAEDLIPFRACIAAGTDAIMTAHLVYYIDNNKTESSTRSENRVTSTSREIITDLLRVKMGYDGVIVTDGMEMKGILAAFNNDCGDAAVGAIKAGNDLVLNVTNPKYASKKVEAAVNNGEIPASQIEDSVTRLIQLKRDRGIIPAQEDSYEATLIHSDGAMTEGTFAEMWNEACSAARNTSLPAPVIRLNKDIAASSTGSFGTGTHIASNGDLVVPAGISVTVDLNGHVLNKNLSDSSNTAGKHLFKIVGGSSNDTVVTIHDSSSAQSGKIIGANGDAGTVAHVTGLKSKFIIDSGTITQNKGQSLVYADANATLRFGVQPQTAAGLNNYSGPIAITGNVVDYAVDFSANMYLMGNTVIKDNSGADVYFNGIASQISIQERGLQGGSNSIGVLVSEERAAKSLNFATRGDASGSNPTNLTQNASAFFYNGAEYVIEAAGTNQINLAKVDGDVRFISSDGKTSDVGTWDEMFNKYASSQAGTYTLLRNIPEITKTLSNPEATGQPSLYEFSYDSTIQFNGHKMSINTNAKSAFGAAKNNVSLVFEDAGNAIQTSKEKVSNVENGAASYNSSTSTLTYYVDELSDGSLTSYKVVEDLSSVGGVIFKTSNGDPAGIIDTGDGHTGVKITIDGGVFTSPSARAITSRGNCTTTFNDGYIVGNQATYFSAGIWGLGTTVMNINGGVIAGNNAKDTRTLKSYGAIGLFSNGSTLNMASGIITGNVSVHSGAGISCSDAATATSAKINITGGTICHNASEENGGGIYAKSSSVANVSNVLISNNSAKNGAGIYLNGTSKVQLAGDTVVMNNSASASAGGIYAAASNSPSGAVSLKDNVIVKDNTSSAGASDVSLKAGNTISVTGSITSPFQSIGIERSDAVLGTTVAVGSGYTPSANDAGKFFIDNNELLFTSKDGNNIVLDEGEAKYVSVDGNTIENGDFKALWDKYFAVGTSGTITLMKDGINVSNTANSSLLTSTAAQATLDLNGKHLTLANGTTNSTAAAISVSAGHLTIADSSGKAIIRETDTELNAGTLATYNKTTNILEYNITTCDNGTLSTKHVVEDLSKVGSINYQPASGSDSDGIINVYNSGMVTIESGRLSASSDARAFLNGANDGKLHNSTVNINGGYIVGFARNYGAVGLGRNGSTTNINGGVIAANTDKNGYGVFWMNSVNTNTFNMNGGTITGNKATKGVLFLDNANSSFNMTGGTITHNVATGNGAVVYAASRAKSNVAYISNAMITANKATGNGAVFYKDGTSSAVLDVKNSHVCGNSAKQYSTFFASGLVLDSVCASNNIATSAYAGIAPTVSATLRGNMRIADNVANSTASNLDVSRLSADKVTINGSMGENSSIGVTYTPNGNKNQKVISSSITLNDTYSNMFKDDSGKHHLLRFNDGSDGIWVIDEDKTGDDLGTGPSMELGTSLVINGKNNPASATGTGATEVFTLHGPGDGAKTSSRYYTNASNGGTTIGSTNKGWNRYLYKPVSVDANGNGTYELVAFYKHDTTEEFTVPKGYIYLTNYPASPYEATLSQTVGSKIYISNLDSRMNTSFSEVQANKTNNLGSVQPVISEGVQSVDYKIHYIYHYYPSAEYGTIDHYIQFDEKAMTGNVGQLAYIPHTEIEGYFESDANNAISKTLVQSKQSGKGNWYHSNMDRYFNQLPFDCGSSDSVNDLYVIFDGPENIFKYNIEYYDADTEEIIATIEDQNTETLPIVATDEQKQLKGYSYVVVDGKTVESIEEVDKDSTEIPTLKLYFKKYPSYAVHYLDIDTKEALKAPTGGTWRPGTPLLITDEMKSIEGYSYEGSQPEGEIIISQDGANIVQLFFRAYPTYTVRYIDYETGKDIKKMETVSVAPNTSVKATDAMKTINGYDYIEQPGTIDELVVNHGSANEMKLYFEKILYKDYTIEYRDVDGNIIHTVTKNAKAGTDIELSNAEKVFTDADGQYYAIIKDHEGNVLTGTVPRTGELTLTVYVETSEIPGYVIQYVNKLTGEIVESGDKVQVVPGDTIEITDDMKGYADRNEYPTSGNVRLLYDKTEPHNYKYATDDERNTDSFTVPDGMSTYVHKMYYYPVEKIDIIKKKATANGWEYINGPLSAAAGEYLYRWVNCNEGATVPADPSWYTDTTGKTMVVPTNENNLEVTLKAHGEKQDAFVICFIDTAANGGSPKPEKNNGLEPIERADTSSLIKMNLYNYSGKTNEMAKPYNSAHNPIFRWSQQTDQLYENGVPKAKFGQNDLSGLGEVIFKDYNAEYVSNYVSTDTNKSKSNINRLAKNGAYGGAANSPYNGLVANTNNPMKYWLDADGNPVLSQNGQNLGYLFPENNGDSAYAEKINTDNINYLFEYDPETGTYSYNSQKNHAQYNAETGNFDVFDQVITPNGFCYQFGNFLPFQDINSQATKLTEVNDAYIRQLISYSTYKSTSDDVDEKQQRAHKALAKRLTVFADEMVSRYGADWDYQDMEQVYFVDIAPSSTGKQKQQYSKDLANGTNKVVPGVTFDDFYHIDYDEEHDFFFGMDFEMDFVIPQDAHIGEKRIPMEFDFEGDDDVWVYIDDIMFLNLSGIHRQVGGKINFAEGKVYYGDLNYSTGYIGYPETGNYVQTFEQILTKAYQEQGLSATDAAAKAKSLLNDKGTFNDWTQHNFKMYYMERGSGSGIMSLNFNLPAVPNNSLLVAKNVVKPDDMGEDEMIGNPLYKMQFVQADDNGNIVRYTTADVPDGRTDLIGTAKPYLPEGTPYMIYKDGAYTGITKYVDEHGIVELREGQFAVISEFAKPGDKYVVRELIEAKDAELFSQTEVLNGKPFKDQSDPSASYPIAGQPEENYRIDGMDYLVRGSRPLESNGKDLSSTLFTNHANKSALAALAFTKDVENDAPWSEDDMFNFAVMLDGLPVSAIKANEQAMAYYVYDKDKTQRDEDGNLIITDENIIEKRTMTTDGIISIKKNEIAVLRYIPTNSKYEIYEVSNPDAAGQYHPIYDGGVDAYVGTFEEGSTATKPKEFNITNQKADNLAISKNVEGDVAFEDVDYSFELSITSTDKYIEGKYAYKIVNMGEDGADDAVSKEELLDFDYVSRIYQNSLSSGTAISLEDVAELPDTIEFVKDAETGVPTANFTLKANQRIIIYGLPYQSTYTITETAQGYQAFYKGSNSDYTEGNTAEFVLDSKATDEGSTNIVEFKNRKIEDMSVSKEVKVDVIDALLGKYENDFQTKFTFSINNATYLDALLHGTYAATITDTYNKTDGADTITETTVSFIDGNAVFELSHGQTITIHGLPYGTTYTVAEESNPAYTTTYKVGDNGIASPVHEGNETSEMTIDGHQKLFYTNSLIMSSLPTTGGVGLIVIALAVLGGLIFLASNMRRRRLQKLDDEDGDAVQ